MVIVEQKILTSLEIKDIGDVSGVDCIHIKQMDGYKGVTCDVIAIEKESIAALISCLEKLK